MSRRLLNWIILVGVIALVIVLDQITKTLVLQRLDLYQTHDLVPALVPLFQITRSENTGSAFGLFPQLGNVFMVVGVIVSAGLVVYAARMPQGDTLKRFAVALVVGGALGNVIDRIQHGVVVDFIHYSIPGVISNVSNVADHAIVGGVIILFVQSWLEERSQKRAEQLSEQTEPTQESPNTL